MTKLQVKYAVEGLEGRFLTTFERGQTAGEFLDLVKEKKKNDDLCYLWKAGVEVPLEDLFDTWYERDVVFQCTSSDAAPAPPPPPTDFPPDEVGPDPPHPDQLWTTTTKGRTKTGTGTQRVNAKQYSYQIFTNVSTESFQRGDTIDFVHESTVDDVKRKVEDLLAHMEGVVVPNPHELHVFLPGGVPFVSGTLYDWILANGGDQISKCNLYVVVTRPLGESVRAVIGEVTDCSSPMMKSLLSPLYDCSAAGYANIACLLGYFQHGGSQSEKLLVALARVTRFAPLVCSLYRLVEQEEMIGLNIIAITGVLHALFRSLLNGACRNEEVFDRALELATVALLIPGGDFLKLYSSEWSDDKDPAGDVDYYCKEHHLQKHVLVWLEDTTDPGLEGCDIVAPPVEQINEIFTFCPYLKAISPLTVRYLYSTAIIRGRSNSMLFIGHVHGNRNRVRYIDPMTGRVDERDIEELGREVGDRSIDDAGEIESAQTGQILEVLFDESISMKSDLDGHRFTVRAHPEEARIEYAKDFLRAFMARTHAYRVASVLGLITFNKERTERSRLTVMESDFENAMNEIKLAAGTCIWDAIHAACTSIRAYNVRDVEGEAEPMIVHPNAVQRILVISDGHDEGSERTPWETAAECIEKNIVVDSVLVARNEDNEELAVLCQMTGGLAFRIENREQGLSLFEQEAFVNIGLRKRVAPFRGALTEAVWFREVRKFKPESDYSTNAPNLSVYEFEQGQNLSSPEYIVYLSQHERRPTTQSLARIVSELKYLVTHRNDSIKVWVNSAAWQRWRVFLKGPDGTPYEGKWWSLGITFPSQYPASPPMIRFLSVPYHPNVASEGRVIFSQIDDGYSSSLRIYDILVSLLALLNTPELEEPIQCRVAEEYRTNRGAFTANATRVTGAQAKANIDDYGYMQGVHRDENPPEALGQLEDGIPLHVTITRPKVRDLMDEGEVSFE